MKKCGLIFVPLFACLLPSCVNNEPIVEEYAVSFVTNGAYEEIPFQRVKKGSVAIEPSMPIRQGYTFKGWFKDPAFEDRYSFSEKVFNNITLYAEWGDIREYTVHFFVDGEEQPKLEETVEYDQKIIKPETPTLEHNVFDGWYEDEDCEGKKFDFDVPLTRDEKTINLYGQFVLERVRVIYNPNGGTMIGSDYEDVAYGGTIAEAPKAKLVNFILDGWYRDISLKDRFVFESDKGTPTPVEGNITLYAKWVRTGHTVKWLNYDGKVLETDVNVATGTDPKYDGTTPNRAGTPECEYVFDGWSPALAPVTSDQIYIAQYLEVNSQAYFKVTIPEESNDTTFEFAFEGTIDYVNWGDGTTNTNPSHTYETAGDYDVRVFGDVNNISINNGKEHLTELYLGNSNTSVADNAFKDCTNLVSVKLADTITSIGDSSFNNCKTLTSINIPDKVTLIKANAFQNCEILPSIIIPISVKTIGRYVFRNNLYLTIYCEPETSEGWDIFWNNTNRPCYWGYISHGTEGDYDYVNTKSGFHLVKYKGLDTSVTMPSQLLGFPVTHLDYTFENNESIQTVTLPNSITSIGIRAFSHCSSLSSIDIPNSVTSIGDSVFEYCTSMTSVTISDSVTSIGYDVFNHCTSIISVIIPNSVTSIGGNAFRDCSSLTIYCIAEAKPEGWNDRWNVSNRQCYWGYISQGTEGEYDYVNTKGGIHLVKYKGTDTSVIVPSQFVELPVIGLGNAFEDNNKIQSVKLPDSITLIGNNAFNNCSSLSSVNIPSNVTSIGMYAFNNCSSLSSIDIPNNLTSIGEQAFSHCSSLSTIVIPSNVTHIGYYAFSMCSSLGIYCEVDSKPGGWDYYWNTSDCPCYWGYLSHKKYADCELVTTKAGIYYRYLGSSETVTVPSKIDGTHIDYIDYAFKNNASIKTVNFDSSYDLNSIDVGTFNSCPNLSSVTIPSNITSINLIDDDAFFNCWDLMSINIPEGVTSIGKNAFFNCILKDSFTLPSTLELIGVSAFIYCKFTSIVIPNNVTSISSSAFYGCYDLSEVTIKNTTEKIQGGADMFTMCAKNLTIKVPNNLLDAYMADNMWNIHNLVGYDPANANVKER